MTRQRPLTVSLCAGCHVDDRGTRDVDAARRHVQAAFHAAGWQDPVEIRTVECLGACEQAASIAIQRPGQANYVFSGVSFPDDAEDVVATCTAYNDSDKGWIEDARVCGRLRHCLRSRVPALAEKPEQDDQSLVRLD